MPQLNGKDRRSSAILKLSHTKITREHVYSDQEYKSWLEAAPEPLRSCSILAHDRGVCRNEMLALQKDCAKLLDRPDERGSWGTVSIKRGLKRDARARILTLTMRMRDVLSTNIRRSKCRYVFTDRDNPAMPLSEFALGAQVRDLKKSLGSHTDCGLHGLRHTFLTKAGDQIRNVRTLQLIAGHANIQTTMRYVHPSQDDLANALFMCDSKVPTPNEERDDSGAGQECCPACGRPIEDEKKIVTTKFTTMGLESGS